MERVRKAKSTVKEVTGDELVAAVDALNSEPIADGPTTSPHNILLVHVFNPSLPVCQLVNSHLDILSAQSAHQRDGLAFLKVRVDQLPAGPESSGGFDNIMFPAFNVYRAGKPVQALVAITRETGPRPSALQVEKYFVTKGIFQRQSLSNPHSGSKGRADLE